MLSKLDKFFITTSSADVGGVLQENIDPSLSYPLFHKNFSDLFKL